MLGSGESEVNESARCLRADEEGVAIGVGRGASGVISLSSHSVATDYCSPSPRRELGLFSGSIPPSFVLSHNIPMINTTSNWLCFGAFRAPPVPSLRIQWPLTIVLPLLTARHYLLPPFPPLFSPPPPRH